MSEAVAKLCPIVESLTVMERDELMDYMTQLQCESLNTILHHRRQELTTGTVKGIPADEYFAQRKAYRS